MENEQVSAPAAAPLPESLPLGEYRDSLDKPASADRAADKGDKPPVLAAAPPVEPGDPVVDDDDDEVETPVERKKKLGGFQKTIARQAAEIEALKRTVPAAPAAGAAAAPAPAAAPAAAAPGEPVYPVAKPQLADCATIEEFTEKTADWKLDQRDWLRDTKAGMAKAQADVQVLADSWNANKATFKETHDDWDAVMAAVADIKLSPAHQEPILRSPYGVELAYELAHNRQELERIAKLPANEAAVEIGMLLGVHKAAALAAAADAADPPEAPVSAAPRPFKPVNGNGAVVRPNPANMPLADYRKALETGRIR